MTSILNAEGTRRKLVQRTLAFMEYGRKRHTRVPPLLGLAMNGIATMFA